MVTEGIRVHPFLLQGFEVLSGSDPRNLNMVSLEVALVQKPLCDLPGVPYSSLNHLWLRNSVRVCIVWAILFSHLSEFSSVLKPRSL